MPEVMPTLLAISPFVMMPMPAAVSGSTSSLPSIVYESSTPCGMPSPFARSERSASTFIGVSTCQPPDCPTPMRLPERPVRASCVAA